jgi:hypothetical protein
MPTNSPQRWHCSNPECGRELLLETTGEIEGHIPRCVCGGAMKKKYAPPVLSYLDFLRLEEPVAVPARPHKD